MKSKIFGGYSVNNENKVRVNTIIDDKQGSLNDIDAI